jgi:cyclic beta-1,2-glucan synthetase
MTSMITSPAAGARLLSNGRFTTLITPAGTGYAEVAGCALTRWQGDPVEDADGSFIYLRDLDSGEFWSVGMRPLAPREAVFTSGFDDGMAWIGCRFKGIEARLEIAVAPDTDRELRTLSLRNLGAGPRRIEVTSYLEVVLNARAAEASHPAFSKLFVQTEWDAASGALLARRRPRGADEAGVWLVQAVSGGGEPQFDTQFETDRKRFIGRGGSLAAPHALASAGPLSGTAGNVLDPAFALRRSVLLDGGAGTALHYVLGAAPDRASALALVQSAGSTADAAQAAASRRRQLMLDSGVSAQQADACEELAAALLYREPGLRAPGEVQRRACGSAAVLHEYKLSAAHALCVVQANGADDPLVTQLVAAARYWQAQALPLQLAVIGSRADWAGKIDHGGPVTLLDPERVPRADLDRIACLARGVFSGSLPRFAWATPQPTATRARGGAGSVQARAARPQLGFFNGNGGFSADGKEYVVRLDWDGNTLSRPPLPWTNVIANEQVGVIVSETGAGYTWSRNSREHRLTPWFNDPVCDPHGEALYLRDEAGGASWSPLPGPAPAGADYEAVHGFGYTTFRHVSHGLDQECTVFVPRHDPLKIVRIRLRNLGAEARTVSLFSYQQLVLGGTPADSGAHVVTEFEDGVLLATNRMAGPFADGVTFASLVAPGAGNSSFTADRAAFLGARGSVAAPAALVRPALDGRSGAGLDPCAAFQATLTIAPGASVECAVLLGETVARDTALALAQRYRTPGSIEAAFIEVCEFWRQATGAVEVSTPLPAVDLMLNGWLVYQNLSCRIWGRSAFYQSGGAYGYRDQLQDSSGMVYTMPALTRRQIRLHAAHQFVEGDVLHWWHPAPLEKGLRTRFADDLLWLPYITAFYINSTGDWGVLDEVEGFLTAPLLEDGEDEVFLTPSPSGVSADVYEHCCRALDRSLTAGSHGLPLMGTGDWNDGMNRVGREGRGESVWMGFFLYRIIGDFLPVCERRGDFHRIERYTAYRDQLAAALDDAGWDGEWYRRAYYDNGVVMGSRESDECKIDALAQAWSVISGAASPERGAQALDAMERELVSDRDKLVRLLTPPFQDTPQDPGYIKGYVAGVRENGGQYTHAACWAVRALAEAGRNERAARVLEMLSPVSHSSTPEEVATYQVEPYVIAADIYGADPHVGRGGWTWYTGSAGWMYRVALESVLGFTLQGGDTIRIKPVIPSSWPGFTIRYRLPDGATVYEISVVNDAVGASPQASSATLDGKAVALEGGAALVPLRADRGLHHVEIVLRSL